MSGNDKTTRQIDSYFRQTIQKNIKIPPKDKENAPTKPLEVILLDSSPPQSPVKQFVPTPEKQSKDVSSPFNPESLTSPFPARYWNSPSNSWSQKSPATPKPTIGTGRVSRFKRNHSAANVLSLDDEGPNLKRAKSSADPDVTSLLDDLKAAFEKPSPGATSSPLQRSKSEGNVSNQHADAFDDFDFGSDPFSTIDFDGVDFNSLENGDWESRTFCERKKYIRYLVLEATAGIYEEFGTQKQEMVLRVQQDDANISVHLHLRGQWCDDFPVESGDYIHAIGATPFQTGRFILDNTAGFLVVHPDTLVNSTQLGVAEDCLRRAVIEERVKKVGDKSPLAVIGQMIHEVVQQALRTGNFSQDALVKSMKEVIQDRIQEVYFAGLDEEDCRQQIGDVLPALQSWSDDVVGNVPLASLIPVHDVPDSSKTCVSSIVDIEENVWSPTFGVKGKIDSTVEIIRDTHGNRQRLAVPMEIKTGKPIKRSAHITQTRIYTLLMSDKYDFPVKSGLLYYTKAADTYRIDTSRSEMVELVKLRNRFASASLAQDLPDMIQRPRQCKTCFEQKSCFVLHRIMDQGSSETSLYPDFDDMLSHVTAQHSAFFKRWIQLVDLEDSDAARLRKEVWTMSSVEREAVGRCFGSLQLVECEEIRERAQGKVSRYKYRFSRPSSSKILASQLGAGDAIVVSTEEHHIALAIGYLLEVTPDFVVVGADHAIFGAPVRLNTFQAQDNQAHMGYMDRLHQQQRSSVALTNVLTPPSALAKKQLFRVDKDEMKGGMGTLRFNLVQLVARAGDEKGRSLIVELETPRFKSETNLFKGLSPDLLRRIELLNTGQHQAVTKSLQAMDYALILGMPGTGKTTLISTLIAVMVAQGKTVLLTSHTHTAVDNVLLKLKEHGVDFVRVGNLDRIHPGVHGHTPAGQHLTTVQACREYFESKPVVALTCLSVGQYAISKLG
jgi:DNA replication ATP-dependent helicase Dna2